jgi:IS605 OrfB family transposase
MSESSDGETLGETTDEASSTQGSPLRDSPETWTVKWPYCRANSLDIKSYGTSVQGLIGSDRDCVPFFDTAWREQYEKLWLPTVTDSADWRSTSSNFLLRKQVQNSWFSMTELNRARTMSSVRTYCPLFMFSPVDITESVSTRPRTKKQKTEQESKPKRLRKSQIAKEKGNVIRGYKIRIQPSENQSRDLRNALGVYRDIYNATLSYDEDGHVDGTSEKEKNRVRACLTNVPNFRDTRPYWRQLPKHGRQQAVEEYFDRKKTLKKRVADPEDKLTHFEMKKKTRFGPSFRQESAPWKNYRIVDGTQYNGRGKSVWGDAYIVLSAKKDSNTTCSHLCGKPASYGRKWDRLPQRCCTHKLQGDVNVNTYLWLKVRGKLPSVFRGRNDKNAVETEARVIRDRLGHYWVWIQHEVKQDNWYMGPYGNVVALDPGCRNFQSWYSDNGSCGSIGKFKRLEDMLERADDIKSALDGRQYSNSKWRRHRRRSMLRIFQKVRNCVSDLHNKFAKFLVESFRLILIPEFKSKEMVEGSRLRSKTCRSMMTWSHYRFKQTLLNMAQKFTDVHVRICNEAYTSKTCGRCGHIRSHFTSETFTCPSCSFKGHRDILASRNILLRALPHVILR